MDSEGNKNEQRQINFPTNQQQVILEYKIISENSEDIKSESEVLDNRNQGQIYCTNIEEDDLDPDPDPPITQYMYTTTTEDLQDGSSTQYIVFSSLEEVEESGQLLASTATGTMEEISEFTEQEIFISANGIDDGDTLELVNVPEMVQENKSIPKSEEVTKMVSLGNEILQEKSWTTVNQVIEEVVRQSAEYVSEQPSSEVVVEEKPKKVKEERDPLTLPFSYAGQSFNIQSQKLILNVMHFFKTHKRDDYIETIKTPQEKAAKVLNVSSSVIGKIRKSWKNGKLELPGKRRKMLKRILDRVSEKEEETIHQIIKDMCDKSITPTIPLILAESRQKINFVGSRTSFRRILHRMGYKYGKVDKKMVMIEPSGTTINLNLRQSNQWTPPPGLKSATTEEGMNSSLPMTTILVRAGGSKSTTAILKGDQLHSLGQFKPTLNTKSNSSPSSQTLLKIEQLDKFQFISQPLETQSQTQGQPLQLIPVQTGQSQVYSGNSLPISITAPLQKHTFQLVHQPQ